MLTIKKNVAFKKEIKDLYKSAFPVRERVPYISLMFQKLFNRFKFNAYYDEGTFVGFVFFRKGKKSVYLNYFATRSECRNKGYGKEIIQLFLKEHEDKPVCLTIESPEGLPEEDIRVRRKNFYERNGLILHPYSASLRGVKYTFMATKKLTEKEAYRVIMSAAGLDFTF